MAELSQRIIALVLAVAAVTPLDGRQSSVPAQSAVRRLEFDAASVKRNVTNMTADGPRGISFSPGGRFAWTSMTLKQLMQSAYVDESFTEVVGGPRWTETDRFDIVATSKDALLEATADGTPHGLFSRLRTLLEDRFKLKTHVENRVAPVFALQLASASTTLGRGLKKTSVDCEAVTRDMAVGRRPEPRDGEPPLCAMRLEPGELAGSAISMDQVAAALSRQAGRPVMNRTGLMGTFDVHVTWTPDLRSASDANGVAPPPTDGASLFTAVREQLGLRLEATRAEVPVLAIDGAQLPDPD